MGRLLVRRFGPLTADTCARLQAVSSEPLHYWAERILDAHDLNDVFDET